MRIWFRRAFVVLVNLIVVVAVLGAMEYGVRTIEARRLGPKALLPSAYVDRWTAWRNAPDYDRVDIHHNSSGFRHDAETPLIKPPNTVRIFFAGGSAAYGCEGLFPRDLDAGWARLYNRDLIDAYIEKRLRQQYPERNWEVVNVATNEFRLHQNLEIFHSTLRRYKPDLVIFFDGHNDVSGIITSTTSPYDPYAETPHGLEFESMVYPHTFRSWIYINATWLKNESAFFRILQSKLLAGSQREAFGSAPDSGDPVNSPVAFGDLKPELQKRATANLAKAEYYAEAVDRLHSALAHEGVASLFVMQPELILSQKQLTVPESRFVQYFNEISGPYTIYMYENLRPRISSQTASVAQKGDYGFLDTGDIFRGVSEKTFTDYCHLTPRGNELIANRIVDHMSSGLAQTLIAGTAH